MSAETYQFPNQLTIRTIADQHHDLISKIERNVSILADVPDDAEIDISFLQLLESARLYAQSNGKHFALMRPATSALLETLTRSGWLSTDDQDIRRFWLHKGDVQ